MSSPHQKNLIKLINRASYTHGTWETFRDFCEMGAIAMSGLDLAQMETREKRYLQIIGRYKPDEQKLFPEMFGELVLALEDEGPHDVLGRVYHELELASKWHGQFFTPNELSLMMAKVMVGDGADIRQQIATQGYVRLAEPAAGGGALILAFAKAMEQAGLDYQHGLHVTAVDVDVKCVHMCYLQMSLLYIPGVVVHGNTLSLEEWGHWYTPAHILGGWNGKLRAKVAAKVTNNFAANPAQMAHESPAQIAAEVAEITTPLPLAELPILPPEMPKQLALF